MTNLLRGEVHMEVGNIVYTLVFNVNAICLFENQLGRGFPSIVSQLTNPDTMSFTTLRAMLWAALQKKHSGITLEEAGELIALAGGFQPVLTKVVESFTSAFELEMAGPQEPSRLIGTGSAS